MMFSTIPSFFSSIESSSLIHFGKEMAVEVRGLIPKDNNARPQNSLPGGQSVTPSTLHAPPRRSRVLAAHPNTSLLVSSGRTAEQTLFSIT